MKSRNTASAAAVRILQDETASKDARKVAASALTGINDADEMVKLVLENERLKARVAELEAELSKQASGQHVPMPASLEHATAMILVAERYLGEHPHD